MNKPLLDGPEISVIVINYNGQGLSRGTTKLSIPPDFS